MSVSTAVPLWMARQAAERAVELLAPHCERITIAGSIRRQQDLVNDIEIVATPRLETAAGPRPGELFTTVDKVDRLAEVCEKISEGRVPGVGRPTKREGTRLPAWGPRFKVMAAEYSPGRWIPLDLFIVAKRSWGPLLTLRTGPASFSKLIVTPTAHRGAMLPGLRMRDGQLEQRVDRSKPSDDREAWEPLYIAEEPEFFDLLKLPFIEPRDRSVRTLWRAMGRIV